MLIKEEYSRKIYAAVFLKKNPKNRVYFCDL